MKKKVSNNAKTNLMKPSTKGVLSKYVFLFNMYFF